MRHLHRMSTISSFHSVCVVLHSLRYQVKVFTESNEECLEWMLIMQDAIFYRKLIAGDEESVCILCEQTAGADSSEHNNKFRFVDTLHLLPVTKV